MKTDSITCNETTALRAVAFTGHRTILPEHLSEIRNLLLSTVSRLYEQGARDFYCGMALGFDLLSAEAVLELKKIHNTIRLIAVIPFEDQDRFFPEADKIRYHNALAMADERVTLCPKYHRFAYRNRNYYLICHCSDLIAYYIPSQNASGTAQTLRMAMRENKTILNLYNFL